MLCHRGKKVISVSAASRKTGRKPSDDRAVTETLVAEAQGAGVKAHVQAMLFQLKARQRIQLNQTA
jgi:hypothetical protein